MQILIKYLKPLFDTGSFNKVLITGILIIINSIILIVEHKKINYYDNDAIVVHILYKCLN